MIPPVQAIKRVLWGNVVLDGKKIPVIKRSYPYDKTPCITIDDSASSTFINRQIINEDYPLDKSHPQFDPFHPFKKHSQQVLRETFQVTVNINIWSDTVNEQEELNNIVLDLFHRAQSDHYQFCDQYHKGECDYMDNTCYAEHFNNTVRTVKGQCPNPLVYGYQNIFTKYHLFRDSFMVEQPFNLDDTSKDEIVYRSVIRLHTGYYTDHIIGGAISKTIDYNENII